MLKWPHARGKIASPKNTVDDERSCRLLESGPQPEALSMTSAVTRIGAGCRYVVRTWFGELGSARLPRLPYLLHAVAVRAAIVGWATALPHGGSGAHAGQGAEPVFLGGLALLAWASLVLDVKRLRDLSLSARWYLLILVFTLLPSAADALRWVTVLVLVLGPTAAFARRTTVVHGSAGRTRCFRSDSCLTRATISQTVEPRP